VLHIILVRSFTNHMSFQFSALQVVLVPVTLGLLLNTYAKGVVNAIQPVMPVVAMVCTPLCIGSPLAINRSKILSSD
jgi:bile acid:Na+ symporter, BASS family